MCGYLEIPVLMSLYGMETTQVCMGRIEYAVLVLPIWYENGTICIDGKWYQMFLFHLYGMKYAEFIDRMIG